MQKKEAGLFERRIRPDVPLRRGLAELDDARDVAGGQRDGHQREETAGVLMEERAQPGEQYQNDDPEGDDADARPQGEGAEHRGHDHRADQREPGDRWVEDARQIDDAGGEKSDARSNHAPQKGLTTSHYGSLQLHLPEKPDSSMQLCRSYSTTTPQNKLLRNSP